MRKILIAGQKMILDNVGTVYDNQRNVVGTLSSNTKDGTPVVVEEMDGTQLAAGFSPILMPTVQPKVLGLPTQGDLVGTVTTKPVVFGINQNPAAVNSTQGGNIGMLNNGQAAPSLSTNVLKIIFKTNTSGVTKKVVIGDFTGLLKAQNGVPDNIDYPQGFTVSYASGTNLTDLQYLGGTNSAPLGVLPSPALQYFRALKINGFALENTTAGSNTAPSAVENGYLWYLSGSNQLSATNKNIFPISQVPKTANNNFSNNRQQFENVDMEIGEMQAIYFEIPDGEALTVYLYCTGLAKGVSLVV